MRVDLVLYYFFCNFLIDLPLLFSLCLSLLIFLFIGHLSYIFVLALLVHRDKQGFWKKTWSKSIFRTKFFKFFFRHLKASDVLQVYDSGLILWTYMVTVLAHTKKSTLIESVNKWGCEGRSKSQCQQLRINTLSAVERICHKTSYVHAASKSRRNNRDNVRIIMKIWHDRGD